MVKVNEEKHMHTLGCSSSSKPCDSAIKHDCVVGQVSQNPKTFVNNSEEDLLSVKREQDLRVPVLNMRGDPLMPTNPAKARHLVEQSKAVVVQRRPFTIQLKYVTGETKQPVTLGIDSGYKIIGFSAVTNKKEILSGELSLRTNISKLLEQRRNYRRTRRSKLWHRKPRFDNRGRTDGWIAPSVQHKMDTHVRLVNTIKTVLPVTETIVEVANFDIQKIKNPDIKGEEYQQGEQLDFSNLRQYIFHRDGYRCQNPKCKSKTKILRMHHISFWKNDHSDRPGNLITLCNECHTSENHKKDGFLWGWRPKTNGFKEATFMSTLRWKLVNAFKCKHTYGYVTKANRIKQGLKKSHTNDAFVIAGGIKDIGRTIPLTAKQVRRNNRSIQTNRNGFKPSIRRQRYKLQPNDLVRYDGGQYRVKGIHCYGSRAVLENKLSVAVKKLELICYGKGLQFISHQNGILEGVSLEE